MSIAIRYAKNLQEAEEIANDGFIKMFNNLEKYKPNKPFTLWLRRIIINCSIDHFRKYHKQSNIVEMNYHSTSTFNAGSEQMDTDYLTLCINKLPPMYRMTFNLSVLDGYSHQEISDQLDVTVGTVKSNLHKARKKLQSMIQEINTISSSNRNEL